MVILIILAFLFLAYLFYIKVINVYCYHELVHSEDTVIDKKEDQIFGLLSSPDYFAQPPSYYSQSYILLKNENEWIPVDYSSYKAIFLNQKIKIVIKYSYYIKRSGFLWKKSDLIVDKEIKIKD